MFRHFPGAHSHRECRECGVMHGTELLPQFPLPQQGRQLMLQWSSRQKHSPAPPLHLTTANILTPQYPAATLVHSCCLQAPPLPCNLFPSKPCTPSLQGMCVAAACAKPGGSGSCREVGLNPALPMNHLQYDLSCARLVPWNGSISSWSLPHGTPMPAAPPKRACGMCPVSLWKIRGEGVVCF